MKVDLVRPPGPRIVRNFIFEDDVHTIVDVTANDQRYLLLWVAANFCFLFVQHIEHGDRIDECRRLCRCRLQGHRQGDRMDRKELPRSILRAQAPRTLRTGLRWFSVPCPVLANTERLQPGSPTMVRGKRRTLSEVRTQPRERQLAGLRIKRDRRPLQRRG